jgi:hypothetical protein
VVTRPAAPGTRALHALLTTCWLEDTMMQYLRQLLPAALLIVAVTAWPARAKNVDLSTVPNRDTVQLTIYNSEDLTLVRETRKISFKTGVNPLQFSWANTLIDPTSVELRFLTHADALEVLDTTFPHDKPQMLYWNVQSDLSGEAMVEITYFTSGISWSADYVGICDAAETGLKLEAFVRVTNASGEDYDNAQVRLVVGTINLTEKIATLAQVPMAAVEEMDAAKRDDLRLRVAREVAGAPAPAGGAGGAKAEAPKEIIKEGLSEYFIYTVEGTETIPNGWSKRMRSFQCEAVPMKTVYRFRVPEYGEQLVRLYTFTNDKASTLGETPLPDGVVRLFRHNGHDGLSFVSAQSIKYVPIGDKIELNLGPDPNVVFEWLKQRVWRTQVALLVDGTNIYRQVDSPAVQIEVNSSVAGWDEHGAYVQRIRNYTAKPIHVEVRHTLPGHVTFRQALGATLHDFQTVEYQTDVAAGAKVDLPCEIVQHSGHNQTQNNVTLEPLTK